MKRLYIMSAIAIQATWTRTTAGVSIPTQWLVKGDSEDGYTVYAVNDELVGFSFIRLPKLRMAKAFIDQVNETGTSVWEGTGVLEIGSFAWRSHPMPETVEM